MSFVKTAVLLLVVAQQRCVAAARVAGRRQVVLTLRGGAVASSSSSASPPTPRTTAKKEAEELSSLTQAIDKRLVLSCIVTYAWKRASLASKALLVASFTCLLSSKVLNVLVPSALRRGVDALESSAASPDAAYRWFGTYCVGKVFVSLASELRSTFFAAALQRATRVLCSDVFAKLTALDAEYHASHPAGGVAVAFSRGARGFASLAFLVFFSVVPTLAELGLSAAALSARGGGPALAVIAVATFATYATFTAIMVDVRIQTRKRLVQLETKRARALSDSLANHDSVKTNANEDVELQNFDAVLCDTQRNSIRSQRLGSVLNFGQATIFALGLAASLAKAVAYFKQGRGGGEPGQQKKEFSIGDVVAVNALLLQLSQPMNFLGYTVSEIRQGLVDLNEMLQIFQEDTGIFKTRDKVTALFLSQQTTTNQTTPLLFGGPSSRKESFSSKGELFRAPPSSDSSASCLEGGESSRQKNPDRRVPPPEIAFEDVWASRNNGVSFALKGASFVAPAGKCTVLVGFSGSGKSTALRLCALLDGAPARGTIRAWDTDIALLGPSKLRRRIAFVPQSTDLFDSSVLYNVRYGDFETPVDDVTRAIAKLSAENNNGDDDQQQHPPKKKEEEDDDDDDDATEKMKLFVDLDLDVGERGARLSGGQRQRVLVARALVRDAPLVLADEPTSSQDAITEAAVLKALLDTGATVVVVAHRLAAVTPAADHVVVFRDGLVVQQGTHAALLKDRKGEYFHLWKASNEQVSKHKGPGPHHTPNHLRPS